MGILIEVIDIGVVEGGGAAFDDLNGVAFYQEKLSEIGVFLAGDPSDQGNGTFHPSACAKV